ncbi:MAG: polysaccharide deacetylase family protein [Muribaculaceae bacterium]|nr:polysaccharide deacetylase family protein [Alistipes senegalensis]MCM1473887.1 polysaccharide deacetylase family protein [Muribaculaceae bacterium]
MYECRSAKRFFSLLILDAVVFSLCALFFFIGRSLFSSSAGMEKEKSIFLPIIMYHSVYGDTPEEYIVTPRQFENDLSWLAENSYTSVTAQELTDYVNGKGSLPEKPVMITLDDGCYNNLSEVLPLLEKYDMHAVVSVVGQYTDVTAERDPHIPAYSYLTWEDIQELIKSGHVEIGNHTYNMHSFKEGRKGCAKNPDETEEIYREILCNDLSRLQQEIHEHTGIYPIVFAYPFGFRSSEAMPIIREQGFTITLTCTEKPNYITSSPDCLYELNRYNRSGFYSTDEFMQKLLI